LSEPSTYFPVVYRIRSVIQINEPTLETLKQQNSIAAKR
jgi:hypothetical protein